MFVIRWFGLDTILCVVSVQLFLMREQSTVSWSLIMGVSMATSLFYLLDRYVDLLWGKALLSRRHFIYRDHINYVIVSLVLLGMGAFWFWLSLMDGHQRGLMMAAVFFIGHLLLVQFSWYQLLKPVVVASLFTYVMAMFHVVSFIHWGVALIFICTLLNLYFHDCVETQRFAVTGRMGFFILGILCCVYQLGGSWYGIVIWGIFMAGYAVLLRYSNNIAHWYEWGELLYAVPFLLGYGLM